MIVKKIVVDTNLLLLWLVGQIGVEILNKHKRLRKFNLNHLRVLFEIVAPYKGIVVTPHCLSELWNLLGEDKGRWDTSHEMLLHSARGLIDAALEVYHPARQLICRDEIKWLGLADVSQISAALEGQFALTSVDGRLCHQSMALGIETHHFWQIAEGP